MCNKNTRRLVGKTPDHLINKPARKSRTKTRKPKYLSLSEHIETKSSQSSPPTTIANMTRQLKNLFPLHPENLVDDRSSADENVALLFHSDAAASASASLAALLQTTAATTTTTTSSTEQDDSLSPSSYDHRHRALMMYDDDNNRSLVKSAMKRNGERDLSEEKWVCYSEVVEEVTSTSSSKDDHVVWRNKKKKKKKKKLETTSSTASQEGVNIHRSLSLALKLDYQGILKAWSDKGSLFIQGGDHFPSSPQTVPDLQHDLQRLMDGWGSSAGNLWNVPESNGLKIKAVMEGNDNGWKMGQREASVLRYKEKRQSRLFSKRIRYEVRKLNAEKRPRMKGRFVKIS